MYFLAAATVECGIGVTITGLDKVDKDYTRLLLYFNRNVLDAVSGFNCYHSIL